MSDYQNLQRLSEATLALYAPGLDSDSYAGRSFQFLSALIPNELIGYGALDAASGSLTADFDHHPPKLQDTFFAYGSLMRKHEAFSFNPKMNGGRPYAITDYYSRRRLRDLDIFQEVHVPMGFSDQCYIHVPCEDGKSRFFGLFRGSDFNTEEKNLLDLAKPHLLNARQVALARSGSEEVALSPEVFAGLGFTPREGDVVYWLTQGKSNIEIGQLMRVRTDTVSSHLRVIYEKMGVENRVAATVCALSLAKKAHARTMGSERERLPFSTPVG